jgi:hypothetical protein
MKATTEFTEGKLNLCVLEEMDKGDKNTIVHRYFSKLLLKK